MHPLFALSLSCLFFGVSFAFDCNGCVSVDEHSFEKLLDKFDVVLLKFDKTYSFKDVHSTFSKVADAAVDNDNILFGLVDIKHFGTQDNMEFAKSQGVTADDVPLLKLYVKGAEKPFVYPKDGPWSISNIKEFINSNSNAYVTKRGRLEVFDKLAKEFITTKDREAVLKKAEEEAAKLTKEKEKHSASTYIKIMRKVVQTKLSFLKKEKNRLKKALSATVNEKKKTELSNHLNILMSFASPKKKKEENSD